MKACCKCTVRSDTCGDLDHHADFPIRNPAITLQIINRLRWNFTDGSGVVNGRSDQILVVIWSTMLPAQPEIRLLLNQL